ncbi:MAG: hypothetical protein NVSMB65_02320 [Chloroflexota bacterium]
MSETGAEIETGPTAAAPANRARNVVAGRYHVTAGLGTGAASTVYLANDLRIPGRQVALKIARPGRTSKQTSTARAHLVTEAHALAALAHPTVASLSDVLAQGEHYALVLEYLRGRTLQDVAGGWSVDASDVLDWGLRLCDTLVHLHNHPRYPLTHGGLRSENCMLMPQGRLVLFDFGTAAGATERGRQRDVRDLAVLLSQLLLGRPTQEEPSSEGGSSPAVRREEDATGLHAVLRQASTGTAPSAAALRGQLLQCATALNLPWGVCLACQSRLRIQARHCGVCGSTVRREHEPITKKAASGTKLLTSLVPGAASPGTAAPPTVPVATARLRFPAAMGIAGQTRRLTLLYADRLRAIGHYLDQQRLRDVTVLESGTEFFVRGHTTGGPQREVPPGTIVSALLTQEDLVELEEQASQARDQERSGAPPVWGGVSTTLFPTGYEDRLRSLGVELDALRGVALVSFMQVGSTLYLDYDRSGADLPTGTAHQHLVLSAGDLEAMRVAATARRRSKVTGQTLAARIDRARPPTPETPA